MAQEWGPPFEEVNPMSLLPCDLALAENAISRHIVECAIEVHRTLGGPACWRAFMNKP